MIEQTVNLDISDNNQISLGDTEEMNRQRATHCVRCHSVTKSDTYLWDKNSPTIIYVDPTSCPVCKSANYQGEDPNRVRLPQADEPEVLKCQCRYPSCEKVFYNRANWYARQQQIAKSTGNPYMPVAVGSEN